MPTKKKPAKRAKRKPEPIERIVEISDLHSGSTLAVCPPGVRLDDDGLYEYSTYQEVLWGWWLEFWGKWVPMVTEGKPYALILNGDNVEGNHHGTTAVISANMSIQARVLRHLLVPMLGADHVAPKVRAGVEDWWPKGARRPSLLVMVRGTEAHNGPSGEAEEEVAEALGLPGPSPGLHSFWGLRCTLEGHLIDFSHHIGTTNSVAYELSALNREVAKCFVGAGQWNDPCPSLIIRSHRHRCSEGAIPTHYGECRIVVSPSWQLHTPFCHSHGISTGSPPQIGGIAISTDPITGLLLVRKKIWTPEKPGPVVLDGKHPERFANWRARRAIQ